MEVCCRAINSSYESAYGVCDPTQGFRFTDSAKENFGKILAKRGHRVIEFAVASASERQ